MDKNLVAPCGMNCSLCLAFQREKKRCPGCNFEGKDKPNQCVNCIIKNCENLSGDKKCFACKNFPCIRIKNLDKRYRTKYSMSMLENLQNIKTNGIENFVISEEKKWKCTSCGKPLCVHRNFCLSCQSLWKIDSDTNNNKWPI